MMLTYILNFVKGFGTHVLLLLLKNKEKEKNLARGSFKHAC